MWRRMETKLPLLGMGISLKGYIRQSNEKTCIAPYGTPHDIVRYVVSLFRHVNEPGYATTGYIFLKDAKLKIR